MADKQILYRQVNGYRVIGPERWVRGAIVGLTIEQASKDALGGDRWDTVMTLDSKSTPALFALLTRKDPNVDG